MSEAGIMSVDGIQAIASTVINRMYCDDFPNTFNGVLHQKNAFSVLYYGTLYRDEPNQKVYDALELALYDDNSNDSLYFLNVELSYAQGWGNNADQMLRSFSTSAYHDGVTFLKKKG